MTTAFSQLANRTKSKVFALTAHALKESGKILWDLLCSNKILGNFTSIELGTDVFALLFNRGNGLSIFEIWLSWVFVTERSKIFKLFFLSLFINWALLGRIWFHLCLLFLITESWELLWFLNESIKMLAIEDYSSNERLHSDSDIHGQSQLFFGIIVTIPILINFLT